MCSRFGGDEFILMGIDYAAHQAEELIQKINAILVDFNQNHDYPYEVGASMGYYIIDPNSSISLEDAIDMADHNMYQIKNKM